MKKLDKYIRGCKKLVDMPYNQLNIANYAETVVDVYGGYAKFINTPEDKPIKLMSGDETFAGILASYVGKGKRKIYLVGKGVLFDSGGYDLKDDMKTMKCDMAGMATAFAIASYFGRDDVVAYCPVATNFIHNNGITPGDYIKIGNKVVEVLNTDAEGRLILAEALSNLKVGKDDIVITIATLTGCCGYAIGDRATGVLTPSDKLAEDYLSIKSKELAWRLPLWDYLQKDFDKKKIPNILKEKCGTTNAGMFLKQFIKYPKNWLHLDIAYSAYNDNTRKATGEPIDTIVKFIKKYI
jgi:leucyl aminopeptidase